MNISATIKNVPGSNEIKVSTSNNQKEIHIAGKETGGSSVNGGELLFLSLATCFCNDVYREAAKRNMSITSVEVVVSGEFGAEGEPGSNINYKVKVESSSHSKEEINELIQHVDKIAEIHNTLRKGVDVVLEN